MCVWVRVRVCAAGGGLCIRRGAGAAGWMHAGEGAPGRALRGRGLAEGWSERAAGAAGLRRGVRGSEQPEPAAPCAAAPGSLPPPGGGAPARHGAARRDAGEPGGGGSAWGCQVGEEPLMQCYKFPSPPYFFFLISSFFFFSLLWGDRAGPRQPWPRVGAPGPTSGAAVALCPPGPACLPRVSNIAAAPGSALNRARGCLRGPRSPRLAGGEK